MSQETILSNYKGKYQDKYLASTEFGKEASILKAQGFVLYDILVFQASGTIGDYLTGTITLVFGIFFLFLLLSLLTIILTTYARYKVGCTDVGKSLLQAKPNGPALYNKLKSDRKKIHYTSPKRPALLLYCYFWVASHVTFLYKIAFFLQIVVQCFWLIVGIPNHYIFCKSFCQSKISTYLPIAHNQSPDINFLSTGSLRKSFKLCQPSSTGLQATTPGIQDHQCRKKPYPQIVPLNTTRQLGPQLVTSNSSDNESYQLY